MENKITRVKEIEIVTTAYFLEERVKSLSNEMSNLRYHNRPIEPKEPIKLLPDFESVPYPEIKVPDFEKNKWTRLKKIGLIIFIITLFTPILFTVGVALDSLLASLLSVLSVLLGVLFIPSLVFVFFASKSERNEKEKSEKEYIEKVKTSNEYINKCNEIDKINKNKYKQADEEADKELEVRLQKYNEQLEIYNNELYAWEEQIKALDLVLNDTEKALNDVYATNVIPGICRNLSAVAFISAYMSTSQFDLGYVIERYNENIQIKLAQAGNERLKAMDLLLFDIKQNQVYNNFLNEQLVNLSEQNNETLDSIDNWQKANIALREYRRIKNKLK